MDAFLCSGTEDVGSLSKEWVLPPWEEGVSPRNLMLWRDALMSSTVAVPGTAVVRGLILMAFSLLLPGSSSSSLSLSDSAFCFPLSPGNVL